MRITTSITWDMSTWAVIDHQWYDYSGPVALLKGDQTLKAQEAAEANFTNTLMQSYKTQFAQQSGILSFLTGKLQPMINNPTGFSADALTSMRTGATENTARSYAQSEQALHEAEAARGGSTLPSGVNAQLEAENANAGAAQNVQSQEGITLANEQQKQQNYWSAVSALSGNASQYNPTGYAGQATSGSSAVGDLGTAYKNSQSSQLLGALGGIAGGIGTAAAGFAKGGCWIAAATFDGWDDWRTQIVRNWLNTEFIKSWYGRLTMKLYMRFGERAARQPRIVRLLKPLFNMALQKAVK